MTPEGGPGVSDFGISRGRWPAGPGGPTAIRPPTTSGSGWPPRCGGSPRPWSDSRSATPRSRSPRQALAAVADRLEGAAGPGRRPRAQPDPVGEPQDFFPTSPVIGFANPVAPPVVVEAVDGGLRRVGLVRLPVRGATHLCPRRGHRHGLRRDAGGGQHPGRQPGDDGDVDHPLPETDAAADAAATRGPFRPSATAARSSPPGTIYHGDLLTAEAEGIFIELIPQDFHEDRGRELRLARGLGAGPGRCPAIGPGRETSPGTAGQPGLSRPPGGGLIRRRRRGFSLNTDPTNADTGERRPPVRRDARTTRLGSESHAACMAPVGHRRADRRRRRRLPRARPPNCSPNSGPDGRLVWVNAALAATLGYAEDELAGMAVAQLVHPDDLGWSRTDRSVPPSAGRWPVWSPAGDVATGRGGGSSGRPVGRQGRGHPTGPPGT